MTNARPSRGLNITLWVVQVILAATFGLAGVMKTTTPIDQLAAQMVWPGTIPSMLVRFIGAAELTAAIGLILPSLTKIQPLLTPLAATGLVTIMALAIPFHISRGELQALAVNVPLGAMAAFVAWGRFKKAPITPRA